MPYPLPLCDDITLPHKSSLSAHNSMYRRRAKLRDVLRIVDRHNTCRCQWVGASD